MNKYYELINGIDPTTGIKKETFGDPDPDDE